MVIAVRGPGGLRAAVAAGFTDKSRQTPAKPSDPQVWGSVTKTYTGAAIMQAVADGIFKLDDSIVPLIDPLLKKMISRRKSPPVHFGSLVDLFGPLVHNVTIRHLLAMNSGVPDYDTSNHPPDKFRQMAYAKPGFDWTPLDILNLPWVNIGDLKFPPGSKLKMKYSSTNFMLLGLVLAQSAGADDWSDYDQRTVWQHGGGSPAPLNHTAFAINGPCSKYTSLHVRLHRFLVGCIVSPIANNWPFRQLILLATLLQGYDETADLGHDCWKGSCLGAFTAGNLVATPQDTADFFYDLFGPTSAIIPPHLVDAMIPTAKPGQDPEAFYGLATFNLSDFTGDDGADRVAYGHLGATYGYQSVVSYHPALQATVAIASNIETPHQDQPADTLCSAYHALKAALRGTTQPKCVYYDIDYYTSVCNCTAV
jgi:CubicO group peptidase (beta-lactamase class C family)